MQRRVLCAAWLAVAAVGAPAAPSWFHFKGFNYTLVDEETTWEEASQNCIRLDSRLAVITSKEANDAIMRHLTEDFDPERAQNWWIGLQGKTKKEARWVDGTPLGFDNFKAGQPTGEQTEGCGEIFSPHQGQWHDNECSMKARSVCQRLDLCGSTCEDVLFNLGEACSCTWSQGCASNAPPPENFDVDSDLYELCPEQCEGATNRTCIESASARGSVSGAGATLALLIWWSCSMHWGQAAPP